MSTDSPLTTDHEEHLASLVRAGYMTVEEIVDVLEESLDDDGVDVEELDLESLVRAKVDERRRQIDEHAGGRPTEYERLMQAFDRLEERGVLARENYWCCQTCAYSAIDKEIDEIADRGETVRGYVLFHSQDTERAADTGRLLLRYGGVTADPRKEGAAASKKIGDELVALLRSFDFAPMWSGSPDETITLPIAWDKRPPEE